MFAPLSVTVPAPALVTPPAPLITADTVNPSAALVVVIVRVAANARFPLIDAFAAPPVDAMLPVRVSVPAPVVTVPPVTPLFTVKAPMLSENPFRSYVPPSLTVTAPVDNALAAPYCNLPALIVVRPVYVLAPDSVHVPVPALVTVPAPVPMMLARLLAALLPSSVNPNPAPVIVPAFDSTRLPLLATMLLALPSVSRPLYVPAVPDVLVSAPAVPPTPVPFNVNASAVPSVNPFRSSVAPLATVVPAAVVPSGVFVAPPAAPNFSVPALMFVAPVYVLAPDSVHVPVPALVTVPAPVPMMLARLLAALLPSSVNPNPAPVIVPAFDSTRLPLLATMLLALPSVSRPLYVPAVPDVLVSAPAVPPTPVPFNVNASAVPSVNPFRSSVAPLATVVPAAVVPNGVFVAPPAAPSFNVPALTVVRPV